MKRSLSTMKLEFRWLQAVAFSLLILLVFFAATAGADLFDENPPVWEPLLRGGKLTSAYEEYQGPPGSALHQILIWEPGRSAFTTESARPIETESRTVPDSSTPAVPLSDDTATSSSSVSDGQGRAAKDEQSAQDTPADQFRRPYQPIRLSNIPPLYLTPRLPGEGEWQPEGKPVGPDGQQAIYKTSYRPSTEYANAIVHMLLFDMSLLSMNLYLGSTEPGGSAGTSTVPLEDRPRLVAVTNALWKQKHSGDAGTIFRGQQLKKLASGMATLAVYKDGSVDILEWNEGIPAELVQDAKQLRHLIVKDGKVVDSIVKGGKKADAEIGLGYLLVEEEPVSYQTWYGYAAPQPQHTYGPDWFIATRSAFGIRPDGNVVFAVGHHISTRDLAKALVLAGCERAIHGDANPHNVLGNIYHVGPDGIVAKKAKLSPDQKTYTLDRYVDKSYTSDFFGFFARQLEEDQS